MNKTALLAIVLAGAALSACAPRGYHDNDRYYGGRDRGPGGVYYTDRDRYNDAYYENGPNREYRDYGGGSRDWRR